MDVASCLASCSPHHHHRFSLKRFFFNKKIFSIPLALDLLFSYPRAAARVTGTSMYLAVQVTIEGKTKIFLRKKHSICYITYLHVVYVHVCMYAYVNIFMSALVVFNLLLTATTPPPPLFFFSSSYHHHHHHYYITNIHSIKQ